MRRILSFALALVAAVSLAACSAKSELVDMESGSYGGRHAIYWEGRTYVPFCVVTKSDCGEQIGYVDGDTDDRVSAYRDYSPEEWLVNWLTMDGGAILMKEVSVTDIPDGLVQEYD